MKLTFYIVFFCAFCCSWISAQVPQLDQSDFFSISKLMSGNASTLTQAWGPPASKDKWEDLQSTSIGYTARAKQYKELLAQGEEVAFVYQWNGGKTVYLNNDMQPILFSLTNATRLDEQQKELLFGNLVFFESEDTNIKKILGEPDKIKVESQDEIVGGLTGMYLKYTQLGMNFYCRALRYSDGDITLGNKLIRVDIYPKRFHDHKLLQRLTKQYYTISQLAALVGQKVDQFFKFNERIGPPQIVQEDAMHKLYHYPSYGFMYLILQEDNRIANVSILNQMETYNAYPGTLPKGLTFNDTVSEVINKLGEPDKRDQNGDQILLYYFLDRFILFFDRSSQQLATITFISK